MTNKPTEILNILARYYRQVENINGKKLFNLLDDYMKKNYKNYNPVSWYELLEKIVKKSDKYKLIKIDYVPITQNELLIIKSINNIRLERLLFTLLCFAKFNNLKNEKNNNWVNLDIKDIFKLARIPITIANQCLMINDLKKLELIHYSKKVDNININALCVDNNSDIILKIDDFRELGYEYMLWCGGKYIRCNDCGILIKQNSKNNLKYCKQCRGYQPIETKTIKCVDCGIEILIDCKVVNQTRCEECYKTYRNNYQKELMRKKRNLC